MRLPAALAKMRTVRAGFRGATLPSIVSSSSSISVVRLDDRPCWTVLLEGSVFIRSAAGMTASRSRGIDSAAMQFTRNALAPQHGAELHPHNLSEKRVPADAANAPNKWTNTPVQRLLSGRGTSQQRHFWSEGLAVAHWRMFVYSMVQ